ncbi:hypothetical protein GQ44DRAFT_753087 [Phaeosphaeriaceae sp. PMI808]|nr:hypothetical protein GQ44DRAFT_753087 [Phaeosphaeriaceae sp. PMI808]
MDHLEDDLDLRFHRGLQPDAYYRCPTLESLDGALRNELGKNVSSLLPLEVVTEFIFAAPSTITIRVAHQLTLDTLIQPVDYLQSITVDCALCYDMDGKTRLKTQRAIAKSIIEAIQDADGFKYSERSAQGKEGGDGSRFRYVCQDSIQHKSRQNTIKKERTHAVEDGEDPSKKGYNCGGAIHIKFSIKQKAIHVVYKHNPIHGSPIHDDSVLSPQEVLIDLSVVPSTTKVSNESKAPTKRKPKIDSRDHGLEMSASPEPPISLWTCHFEPQPTKKRSKNGCINCKTRRRKCTEEQPSCAHCLRIDDDCQYLDYS